MDSQLVIRQMTGQYRVKSPDMLALHEDCIGRIWNRRTKISCSVNTQVGEERAFKIEKTNDPKNIVIIGAGPSGLEAARVAASHRRSYPPTACPVFV